MTTTTVIATGKTFDPATRAWTLPVEYIARDRIDALRWINFNRDWMKDLRIVEEAA